MDDIEAKLREAVRCGIAIDCCLSVRQAIPKDDADVTVRYAGGRVRRGEHRE